jgi:hypothetical protein
MNPLDFKSFEENVIKIRQVVGAFSKHANSGFPKINHDILLKRKEICSSCEFWDKNGFAGTGKCNKCGCSVAKLYLPASECPIKKWGKQEIDIG